MDNTLVWTDVSYRLMGVIFHTGDTPDCGHYVAVSRHDDSFFLYNDGVLGALESTFLQSTMHLPGLAVDFHAAALLYETAVADDL